MLPVSSLMMWNGFKWKIQGTGDNIVPQVVITTYSLGHDVASEAYVSLTFCDLSFMME